MIAAEIQEDTVSSDVKPTINIEAEYQLESNLMCPACRELVSTLKVVRMLRTRVNFTSTLPRRGRAVACPECSAILSAELPSLS